jgi:hypothetical protein
MSMRATVCPSCEHDLSYPGQAGHECYSRGNWYDDRMNLAMLAYYMFTQGDTAADVAYMLQKPEKYADDWKAAVAAQPGAAGA